ncbi:TIGR03619 family F420-dependent LLM class oxidoreductase [Crossiella cryophila]|uniref:Putative F420-dependent oxidoreductase n=1 Tax=Crossiella cryophila TaxID=43355 RepID=A0A7W7CEI2_9PSEU|nr:TIGR03619 family F420-dependent LLM class oxidoreductase [Crossiella cryophila]MBB4679676.1 putative F420-dependent oxidoreductase [Crossiella cryophila]
MRRTPVRARLGLALPQYGHFADPALTLEVAAAAEQIGFDSLWVSDRLLLPLLPGEHHPGPHGGFPPEHGSFLDPLTLLTLAATATSSVRLGTSALHALWQPPVLLARTLTTLDQLSGGRLDVGIGLGWSSDEYQAAGVPWSGRGARLEETLDVLEAVWTGDPVEHKGPLWTVPRSTVPARPRQSPRPPLLLAGSTPRGLLRAARRADGWLAADLPLPALAATVDLVRAQTERFGRDPAVFRTPLRITPRLTADQADPSMLPGRGTVEQLTGYLRTALADSVDEVILDLQLTAGGPAELLDLAGEFHRGLRD